jgi:hypothetical protein
MASIWHRFFWVRVATLGVVSVYALVGWDPDVRFESSDALWHDQTFNSKGHDFKSVLFDFEQFRTQYHRPTVTLVRTTRRSAWNAVSWIGYLVGPEWQVPWTEQKTCVNRRCSTAGLPNCDGADGTPVFRIPVTS